MSLINDALKRASRAQPSTPAQPEVPMQPNLRRRPVGLPGYFMPVVLFIVSGACWFMIKGWDTRRQAGLYPEPVTVQARELPAPPKANEKDREVTASRNFAVSETTASAKPATAASTDLAKANAATASAAPGAANVASSAAIPTATAPESTGAFKLQGIFYRNRNPSVVINSKTLFIGDTIANGKVTAIGRDRVTLDVGGDTLVLTLR